MQNFMRRVLGCMLWLLAGPAACVSNVPQKQNNPSGSTPHFLWSQTLSTVEILVKVPDPKEVEIDFEIPNVIIVQCRSGKSGGLYRLVLRMFGAIDGLDAVWDIGPSRNAIVVEMPKAQSSRKPWPRLLKSKESYRLHLGINWDKWIDFQEEALKALMNRRFHTGNESPEQKEQFRMFEEWVRDAGLVDEDDDLDAAIEDLWRERLEQQETQFLDYQNYDILRKDLHELLQKYPHGSDLSGMSRADNLRLEHLMYHYDRLEKEADALRESRKTESGMFESHIEREHLMQLALERRKKKEL